MTNLFNNITQENTVNFVSTACAYSVNAVLTAGDFFIRTVASGVSYEWNKPVLNETSHFQFHEDSYPIVDIAWGVVALTTEKLVEFSAVTAAAIYNNSPISKQGLVDCSAWVSKEVTEGAFAVYNTSSNFISELMGYESESVENTQQADNTVEPVEFEAEVVGDMGLEAY